MTGASTNGIAKILINTSIPQQALKYATTGGYGVIEGVCVLVWVGVGVCVSVLVGLMVFVGVCDGV